MPTYLYLYDGPGEPISAEIDAEDIETARQIAARETLEWRYDARDDLDLGEEATGAEIADALDFGGWQEDPTYVAYGEHWALYERA